MERNVQGWVRYAAAVVMLALPVVLLLSSIRTLGELEETKTIYLRNRAATLAARLENLRPEELNEDLLDRLADEEPALVDLRIYGSPEQVARDPVALQIWDGQALFHTAIIQRDGEHIFRIYTPFHVALKLHVARIDLAADAADFLVIHARHHLLLSFIASVALMLFTAYFLWSERRAVRLGRRQLELEHLAHLGEMSAVLAHEIRNPLGTIKGFVQLAREKASDALRPLLDPVLEETARLEKLVNDLLAYGRPRTPELRRVRWEELAAELEAHAAEAIGDRPIRFRREGEAGEIETDPDLLRQILLNLIRNSIEALNGAPAGEVILGIRPVRGGRVAIVVEDDGPGLPEKVRDRLFEPFATTKSNGTGLGLPIARKLTLALGGRIEIRARSPRGTRAELLFPSLGGPPQHQTNSE